MTWLYLFIPLSTWFNLTILITVIPKNYRSTTSVKPKMNTFMSHRSKVSFIFSFLCDSILYPVLCHTIEALYFCIDIISSNWKDLTWWIFPLKCFTHSGRPRVGPHVFPVTQHSPCALLPFQHSCLYFKNRKCLDWGLAKTESYHLLCNFELLVPLPQNSGVLLYPAWEFTPPPSPQTPIICGWFLVEVRRLRSDNIQIMQSCLAITAIKIDLQVPLLVLKLCEAGIWIYSVGL